MQQQRINGPYGDSFLVGMPNTQRFAQQMYMEQKQRELVRQKQAEALDQEFAKNVSGVRDADINEVTKKYGEWKMAAQNAMKKKGAKGISPEEQLQLLQKKADIYKTINASKQALQEEDDIRKELNKNPDQFDDNAATFLAVRRKTPLSGFSAYKDPSGKPIDLADYNTYRYKGTDTDFSKIEREAAGTPKQVFTEETPVTGDNFQIQMTPYTYGNTPGQFYQNYLGALSQRKAGRDAAAMLTQIPTDILTKVDEQYRAIPVETWKKMGVDKPQELIIENDDSKAEIFAKHQAQLYALNNEPKKGMPVFRENKAAVLKAQEEKEKRMEAIKNSNAAGLIRLRKSLGVDSSPDTKDLWIDTYVENATNEANNKTTVLTTVLKDGKKVKGKEIDVDPTLAKAVGIDEKNPGTIIVTEDGKYVPVFYETDGDNRAKVSKTGNYEIKRERSSPMTEMQIKIALGKSGGTKQYNKEAINAVSDKNTPKTKGILD